MFWLSMNFKKATTCLFLAYLVLFLNLGQGLHHAGIFGFHSHGVDELARSESGCSCSHHKHQSRLPIGEDETFHVSKNTVASHDCPICDFFSHYQVTFGVWAYSVMEAREVAFCLNASQTVDISVIPPQARGPPSCVFGLKVTVFCLSDANRDFVELLGRIELLRLSLSDLVSLSQQTARDPTS